jgi:hypothetical protein
VRGVLWGTKILSDVIRTRYRKNRGKYYVLFCLIHCWMLRK